jgi:hypothetical protein
MKALTWQGTGKVSVEEVPDPWIEEPTDAVVRMTSTAICGSDLHLYDVLGMYLTPGDIIGHEPMGIVEEVGSEVTHIQPGDRVVIPFNISCGHCWMCTHGFMAQCETTQVRSHDKGAAMFGYTSLYGAVPGGQAEYLRVPQAQFGPIKVPQEHADERWLFLSDILPTAWQSVKYADVGGCCGCCRKARGPAMTCWPTHLDARAHVPPRRGRAAVVRSLTSAAAVLLSGLTIVSVRRSGWRVTARRLAWPYRLYWVLRPPPPPM